MVTTCFMITTTTTTTTDLHPNGACDLLAASAARTKTVIFAVFHLFYLKHGGQHHNLDNQQIRAMNKLEMVKCTKLSLRTPVVEGSWALELYLFEEDISCIAGNWCVCVCVRTRTCERWWGGQLVVTTWKLMETE